MSDEIKTLFVNYSFDVRFVRVIENVLVPTRLEMRAEVDSDPDVSEDDLNKAFAKISFWIDNIVTKCVAFSAANAAAIDMFIDDKGVNRSGNLIMLTPDDPSDEHLATIFQSKLNALAGGTMEFGTIEIVSDNTAGLSFTFVGIGEDHLPTVEEWLGDRYYFDKPWWSRDDASILDVPPTQDTDVSKPPAWAYSLDFIHQGSAQDTVVIRPEFRPTIIAGGKDDPEDKK